MLVLSLRRLQLPRVSSTKKATARLLRGLPAVCPRSPRLHLQLRLLLLLEEGRVFLLLTLRHPPHLRPRLLLGLTAQEETTPRRSCVVVLEKNLRLPLLQSQNFPNSSEASRRAIISHEALRGEAPPLCPRK